MCGIVGKLNIDGSSPDQGLLRRMVASLALRDPDDEGFYFDDHIGLGHRRLSIIDLESGSQPLANALSGLYQEDFSGINMSNICWINTRD